MRKEDRPRITSLAQFDEVSQSLYDQGLTIDEAMTKLLIDYDIDKAVVAAALARTIGLPNEPTGGAKS